ncbi:hypothetical protein EDM57_04760 [Brevibacillus gelatini]|uniref:Uncharacterized protein n=1 Tax=Brevibacillus gelatini TaxID=1655277 RepID=A0A3M8B901_9BACL|nr:hypothetical protein [Brevibacillus gelatini]RNB59457.1 hypothetical protein EDM57_04760 [Brevibacillus gelatini]
MSKVYTKAEAKKLILRNLRALSTENKGKVTPEIYKSSGLKPSYSYIKEHFGWTNILREANIMPHPSMLTAEELIQQLKDSIKELGYIPTSTEYDKLKMKPDSDSLSKRGLTWSEAMNEAGFRTYGKPVKVKDRVCYNAGCYNQYTPEYEHHWYCDECQKDIRGKFISKLNDMKDANALRKIALQLATSNNSFRTITFIMGLDKN